MVVLGVSDRLPVSLWRLGYTMPVPAGRIKFTGPLLKLVRKEKERCGGIYTT